MSVPLTREDALEFLSQWVYAKLEHIDPTGESWDDLDDQTRDMYRSAIRHLFEAPPIYLHAALPSFPGNDVMRL